MLQPENRGPSERLLTLKALLEDLLADGRVAAGDLRRLQGLSTGVIHPLVFLAEQKLRDLENPEQTLDMSALLRWLSGRSGQAVVEIDPLKINVSEVSEVMSRAFAERHRILAVGVNDDDVLIASAEPFQRAWQTNLEHVLRKPIRRVITDPRDLQRYTAEFYTMAGSVRGAR
ncbi:MAG: type II/IV secretion system protein, partial [Congregibacter sp.]|nr:type II/IV secretion system protein [Congregibacter sp.]